MFDSLLEETINLINGIIVPIYQQSETSPPKINELVDLLKGEGIDCKLAIKAINECSKRDDFFYERLGYQDTCEDVISGAYIIREFVRAEYNNGKNYLPQISNLIEFAHNELRLSPKNAIKAVKESLENHRDVFKAAGYDLIFNIAPGSDNLENARKLHPYI